jgi:hypothetical protein
MREFTKSLFSFSWAMSLFGARQMTGLLSRPGQGQTGGCVEAMDEVTKAMENQLGETLEQTFKAGDKLQRGALDMMFGMFGGRGMKPGGMEEMMRGMSGWGGCGPCGQEGQEQDGGLPPEDQTGWGPMPPVDPH